MSHYAQILDGFVINVIVAEQDVINSGLFGNSNQWVQTSYNTHGGVHPEGKPLRKNYAAIGYTYDSVKDAFIPPQPFPSWTLDEQTCQWQAPVPCPTDSENYIWNEPTVNWVVAT